MTRLRLVLLVGLVLASVLVFAGSWHGDFVWDDHVLIYANTSLRQADFWKVAFAEHFFGAVDGRLDDLSSNQQIYRPIITILYGLQWRAWGLHSEGFHAVNLAVHACSVVLVFFWLARRLAPTAPERVVTFAAGAGALVFAVHPSRAESVAWISGSTDLWMALFIMTGLTVWDRSKGLTGALLAGGCFSIAMLCKEVAVVAPLALLLDEWWRGARGRAWLQRGGVAGAVVAGVLALRFGVMGPIRHGDLGTLLQVTLRVLATLGGYVRLVLFPWPASTQSGYLPSATSGDPVTYPPVSITVGVGLVVMMAMAVAVSGKRPALRPWLGDATWFIVPLGPVLNILPIASFTYIADRHLYLALLGVAALTARLTTRVASLKRSPRLLLAGAGTVLCASYAIASATHARHFMSAETLWTYEAARQPENVFALRNLMQVHVDGHRYDEAQTIAQQIIAVMPRAEDKAATLEHWLEVEVFRAQEGDDAQLPAVKAEFDSIAAHAEPTGMCGQLYATIGEEGRRWLRRSTRFRTVRARAAAMTGDFASAVRQLEALGPAGGSIAGVPRLMVSTLLGSLNVSGAEEWLARLPGGERTGLSEAVSQVHSLDAASAAQPEGRAAVAFALLSAGEPALARALTRNGLMSAPDSPVLLRAMIQVDINGGRPAEARTLIARLRQVSPGESADLERLLVQIDPPRE